MLTNMFNHSPESAMNTACTPCCTTPLGTGGHPPCHAQLADCRPHLVDALESVTSGHGAPAGDLTALDGLNAHSLKDIGAPEWV